MKAFLKSWRLMDSSRVSGSSISRGGFSFQIHQQALARGLLQHLDRLVRLQVERVEVTQKRLGLCLGCFLLAAGVFAVACSSAQLYYLDSELPRLKGDSRLVVGPGPWPITLGLLRLE